MAQRFSFFIFHCSFLWLLSPLPSHAQEAGAPGRDLRLIEAVQRRDQGGVERLLKAKADVNARRPDGATALAWAVHLGESRLAAALLDAGANPSSVDEYGESPVTLAAANGDADTLGRLLQAGASARASRWNGETALMIAAGAGSPGAVRLLVLHGADVNTAEPRRGQTALMWAAAEGHSDVVSALIDIGADVRRRARSGFDALAFAVSKNDATSVKSLLVAGADPNLVMPSGNKLLMMAMGFRHTEAAAALVDGGADVRATDRAGTTPLHIAAQVGDQQLVETLLARGADPNVRTPPSSQRAARGGGGGRLNAGGSMTPLMAAARGNHPAVMRALVASGADATLVTDNGTSLLMFAAGGTLETVRYAHELDGNVQAVNAVGQTPMHAAVAEGIERTQEQICEVIQFLADRGAALDELDKGGRTPIVIADVDPIDKAVELLTALIEKSGSKPKIPSKR